MYQPHQVIGGKGPTIYLHVVVISSNFTCNGCAYWQRDSSVSHVKLLIIRENAMCLQHLKQTWEITCILCTCSGLGCAVSRANSLWNFYLWVHRGSFEWQGGKQEGRKVTLTSILGILVWAVLNSVISPAWLSNITGWFVQCEILSDSIMYINMKIGASPCIIMYTFIDVPVQTSFSCSFVSDSYLFIRIGPSSL